MDSIDMPCLLAASSVSDDDADSRPVCNDFQLRGTERSRNKESGLNLHQHTRGSPVIDRHTHLFGHSALDWNDFQARPSSLFPLEGLLSFDLHTSECSICAAPTADRQYPALTWPIAFVCHP
jgi:hypothetical protein